MPSFVHVTTSATLALLPRTHFQLTSLHDLVFAHKIAPLAGEIATGRAMRSVTTTGTPRFAAIDSTYWTTKRLLTSYGKNNYRPKYDSTAKLIAAINECCEKNFESILGLIIYIMRDNQMRQLAALKEDQKKELVTAIHATMAEINKIYAINYLTARFFCDKIENDGPFDSIANLFIRQFLNTLPPEFISLSDGQQAEYVKGFVAFDSSKFAEQYAQLSIEEQSQFSQRYAPETDLVRIYSSLEREYECKAEFLYRLKMLPDDVMKQDVLTLEPGRKKVRLNPAVSALVTSPSREESRLLSEILSRPALSVPDLDYMKSSMLSAGEYVFQQVALLTALINNELESPNFQHHPWVTHAFPIAFVLNDQSLLKPIRDEYEAMRNLTLGKDILTILVEEDNIPSVQEYLTQQQLYSVKVVSFAAYYGEAVASDAPPAHRGTHLTM